MPLQLFQQWAMQSFNTNLQLLAWMGWRSVSISYVPSTGSFMQLTHLVLLAYYSLEKATPLSGNISNTTQWIYFSYTPGSNDNYLVGQLNITTPTPNATVARFFVKFVGSAPLSASWPRTDYYDFRDPVDSDTEAITVTVPQIGLWIFGVYNIQGTSFDYQIMANSSGIAFTFYLLE